MFSFSHKTPGGYYEAVRLNGGQPLISQQTFRELGDAVANEGNNINGPSVIRVPEWIPLNERPDASARYYLYFAHHQGKFIRMAWAADITGPYTLYNVHPPNDGLRGVLDMGKDSDLPLANGLTVFAHIASPDVHVDDVSRKIVVYFHGPTKHNGQKIGQKTFVAESDYGLDFNGGIRPVILAMSYLRVFKHAGKTYGVASHGTLYEAPEQPHTPPAGFDYASELWNLVDSEYSGNPFQFAIDQDPSGVERLRHNAVRLKGDTLEVFHTRVGDTPERILFTTIDLGSPGGPRRWQPLYPPVDVLWPEKAWEGSDRPLEPSSCGFATKVNQLRDPHVFEDADGSLYLFYSGGGEDAIGIAALKETDNRPVYPAPGSSATPEP